MIEGVDMVICFKCSPRAKRILENFLESEDYGDYSQIITTALENLEVLHKNLGSSESIILPSGESEGLNVRTERFAQNTLFESSLEIPQIFLLGNPLKAPSVFAEYPEDELSKGSDIPLDKWIFGQFNKFLPVKAVCRALANLSLQKNDGIQLEEAWQEISGEAVKLSTFLKNLDLKNKYKFDHATATAFPQKVKFGQEKKMARFSNQFIGSVNKKGELSGFVYDLKFVNKLDDGKENKIALTKRGWEFAQLNNPVLDRLSEKPARFSDEEIHFLIKHIKEYIPKDLFAFRTIKNLIENGSKTPENLDADLEKNISNKRRNKLTKGYLSTQRSGVVSRMVDLGLIKRERKGVNVTYQLTENGIGG